MSRIFSLHNAKWLIGAWTLYILTFIVQITFLSGSPSDSEEGRYLMTNIVAGLLSGIILIVFFIIPLNNILTERKISTRIIILILCSLIFCPLYILITVLIQASLMGNIEYPWIEDQIIFYGKFNFHNVFKSYIFLTILLFALDYYQRKNILIKRENRLKTRLAQVELQNLKSQFQPHFLFNALNSIVYVIDENKDKAQNMLIQLSDILRISIGNDYNKKHRLSEELKLLEKYLAIEKVRYGEQLIYNIDVPDTEKAILVPFLLIQPIIENAIKHGFKKNENPLVLKITVNEDRSSLLIMNNGTPLKTIIDNNGLSGIKDRLRILYGTDGIFKIYQENGWVINEIDLKSF